MDNRRQKGNSDDRPIQAKGKYDLNFIDWNNEWGAVYNKGYDFNNPNPNQPSPICGMSPRTFVRLLQEDSERFQYEQEQQLQQENKLEDNHLTKIQKMKMGKSSKECTICCVQFEKGVVIMKLPCSHIFHEQCIMPWFQRESKCPNCRLDLKQHYQNQNK